MPAQQAPLAGGRRAIANAPSTLTLHPPRAGMASPAAPPSLQLLRWRSRAPLFMERTGGLELPMLRIPAGRFLMGSPPEEEGRNDDEDTPRQVTLAEFLISRTPITVAQWRAVARWSPQPGDRWTGDLPSAPLEPDEVQPRTVLQKPPWRVLLSTTTDLKTNPSTSHSYLDSARKAVITLGHIPIEMNWDHLPASDESPEQVLLKKLIDVDVFVAIGGPELVEENQQFLPHPWFWNDLMTARAANKPCLLLITDRSSPDLRIPKHSQMKSTQEGHANDESKQVPDLDSLIYKYFRSPDHLQHELYHALRFAETKALSSAINPDSFSHPITGISHEDASEFCRRLSERSGRDYRLPSEAQWEYACRAGTSTPFNTGITISPDLANYNGNVAYGPGTLGEFRQQTTPVAQFPANAWGVHDMHGNVWEWCEAPVDATATAQSSEDDALGVMRGGSWNNHPRACRSASRFLRPRHSRLDITGFRVVCLPPGCARSE